MTGLSQSSWCDPSRPIYSLGLVLYIVLVVFFAYFYTSITFNPIEISNNMKRQGGFIQEFDRVSLPQNILAGF